MYKKIHPYALIIGMLAGFGVLLILRHLPFALFAGFCGVLLADVLIKRGSDRNLP